MKDPWIPLDIKDNADWEIAHEMKEKLGYVDYELELEETSTSRELIGRRYELPDGAADCLRNYIIALAPSNGKIKLVNSENFVSGNSCEIRMSSFRFEEGTLKMLEVKDNRVLCGLGYAYVPTVEDFIRQAEKDLERLGWKNKRKNQKNDKENTHKKNKGKEEVKKEPEVGLRPYPKILNRFVVKEGF
ncbi:hypothetical protein NE237_019361 [Protea cynaroides]|uniref:Uncharacterized protein n=1 Tax=Protea cynaroides TaxID=273540 RepID=A0A9Q0QPV4_9MAGN|nr:hypothetical protein NE237_019361 [Protea cynaroides]